MKKIIATVALLFTMALPALAATTISGVLTDDMCTKKHMIAGKSNAECVRECIKHGAKYAIVADGKVYLVSGDSNKFNELAGKKVKATGEVKGKTFVVSSIEAAQ